MPWRCAAPFHIATATALLSAARALADCYDTSIFDDFPGTINSCDTVGDGEMCVLDCAGGYTEGAALYVCVAGALLPADPDYPAPTCQATTHTTATTRTGMSSTSAGTQTATTSTSTEAGFTPDIPRGTARNGQGLYWAGIPGACAADAEGGPGHHEAITHGAEECDSACWARRACTGYSVNAATGTCFLFYDPIVGTAPVEGADINCYVKQVNAECPRDISLTMLAPSGRSYEVAFSVVSGSGLPRILLEGSHYLYDPVEAGAPPYLHSSLVQEGDARAEWLVAQQPGGGLQGGELSFVSSYSGRTLREADSGAYLDLELSTGYDANGTSYDPNTRWHMVLRGQLVRVCGSESCLATLFDEADPYPTINESEYFSLSYGDYDLSSESFRFFGNRTSSVEVFGECVAQLQANSESPSYTFPTSPGVRFSSLGENLDDQVNLVRVLGTCVAFVEFSMGFSFTIYPGNYQDVGVDVADSPIESVEVQGSGCTLTLFNGSAYSGEQATLVSATYSQADIQAAGLTSLFVGSMTLTASADGPFRPSCNMISRGAPSPSPPVSEVLEVKSTGTQSLPHCTWENACPSNQGAPSIAPYQDCATFLCEAQGYKQALLLGVSNDMCETGVATSGDAHYWAVDTQRRVHGVAARSAQLWARCLQPFGDVRWTLAEEPGISCSQLCVGGERACREDVWPESAAEAEMDVVAALGYSDCEVASNISVKGAPLVTLDGVCYWNAGSSLAPTPSPPGPPPATNTTESTSNGPPLPTITTDTTSDGPPPNLTTTATTETTLDGKLTNITTAASTATTSDGRQLATTITETTSNGSTITTTTSDGPLLNTTTTTTSDATTITITTSTSSTKGRGPPLDTTITVSTSRGQPPTTTYDDSDDSDGLPANTTTNETTNATSNGTTTRTTTAAPTTSDGTSTETTTTEFMKREDLVPGRRLHWVEDWRFEDAADSDATPSASARPRFSSRRLESSGRTYQAFLGKDCVGGGGRTPDLFRWANGVSSSWGRTDLTVAGCKAMCDFHGRECFGFVWRKTDGACFWKGPQVALRVDPAGELDCYLVGAANVRPASGGDAARCGAVPGSTDFRLCPCQSSTLTSLSVRAALEGSWTAAKQGVPSSSPPWDVTVSNGQVFENHTANYTLVPDSSRKGYWQYVLPGRVVARIAAINETSVIWSFSARGLGLNVWTRKVLNFTQLVAAWNMSAGLPACLLNASSWFGPQGGCTTYTPDRRCFCAVDRAAFGLLASQVCPQCGQCVPSSSYPVTIPSTSTTTTTNASTVNISTTTSTTSSTGTASTLSTSTSTTTSNPHVTIEVALKCSVEFTAVNATALADAFLLDASAQNLMKTALARSIPFGINISQLTIRNVTLRPGRRRLLERLPNRRLPSAALDLGTLVVDFELRVPESLNFTDAFIAQQLEKNLATELDRLMQAPEWQAILGPGSRILAVLSVSTGGVTVVLATITSTSTATATTTTATTTTTTTSTTKTSTSTTTTTTRPAMYTLAVDPASKSLVNLVGVAVFGWCAVVYTVTACRGGCQKVDEGKSELELFGHKAIGAYVVSRPEWREADRKKGLEIPPELDHEKIHIIWQSIRIEKDADVDSLFEMDRQQSLQSLKSTSASSVDPQALESDPEVETAGAAKVPQLPIIHTASAMGSTTASEGITPREDTGTKLSPRKAIEALRQRRDSEDAVDDIVGGTPVYRSGQPVEYFSKTHQSWVRSVAQAIAVGTNEDGSPDVIYSVLIGKAKQHRFNVPLDALRPTFMEGEAVEVFHRADWTWRPGEVEPGVDTALGYRVRYVDEKDDEPVAGPPEEGDAMAISPTLVALREILAPVEKIARPRIHSTLIRHRFAPGAAVEVYAGCLRGWVPATVAQEPVSPELEAEVLVPLTEYSPEYRDMSMPPPRYTSGRSSDSSSNSTWVPRQHPIWKDGWRVSQASSSTVSTSELLAPYPWTAVRVWLEEDRVEEVVPSYKVRNPRVMAVGTTERTKSLIDALGEAVPTERRDEDIGPAETPLPTTKSLIIALGETVPRERRDKDLGPKEAPGLERGWKPSF